MTKEELGPFGEQLAVDYLIKNGYSILDRNVRFKKYERDIVATKENELVIVEVKARNTVEIGEPRRAVTRSKQRQIIQVADYYVQSRSIDMDVRFDVISIVHNTFRTDLEHLPAAFDVLRWKN